MTKEQTEDQRLKTNDLDEDQDEDEDQDQDQDQEQDQKPKMKDQERAGTGWGSTAGDTDETGGTAGAGQFTLPHVNNNAKEKDSGMRYPYLHLTHIYI